MAEGQSTRPRVVMVTDVPFWFESKGSERRISALLRWLAGESDSLAVASVRPLRQDDLDALTDRFPALWVYGPNATWAPGGTLPPIERTHAGGVGLAPTTYVDTVLQAERPNTVLVEYVRLAHYAEHGDPNLWGRVVRVIDTHDVMHLRAEACREHGSSHFLDITREQEAKALGRFDLALAIQEEERRELESLTDMPVVTVHHAHPIAPIPERGPTAKPVFRLGFASAEDDSALISLKRFLADTWPGVRDACDDHVELRLYGRLCARFGDAIAKAPGVVVRGFVDKPIDVFRECDAIVNLVEFGSGLKIKSVEALCHNRPLITTPEGATGLPPDLATTPEQVADDRRAAYVVCDSSGEWIAALAALARDPIRRQVLAEHGLALAERMFAPAAAFTPLWDALASRIPERGIAGPPANEAGRRAAIERAEAIRNALKGGVLQPVTATVRPLPGLFSLAAMLDRADATVIGDGRRVGVRNITVARQRRRAIAMPPPTAVDFTIPDATGAGGAMVITFATGLQPECWDEPNSGPARFAILVDGEQVFSWDMNPAQIETDRMWQGHRVYVPARPGAAERTVRLLTFGVGGDACRWTVWAEPTVALLPGCPVGERAWHAPVHLAPPELAPSPPVPSLVRRVARRAKRAIQG